MPKHKHKFHQPTKLDVIREKVLTYHAKMNAIAKFLRANKAPEEIQIDPSKEYLEFYIEKDALIRLNNIALLPGFDSFVVFLGLADSDSVTGCFLGIDKQKRILDAHRIKKRKKSLKYLDGEDTWLPPGGRGAGARIYKPHPNDFTLKTPPSRIAKHLS